MNTPAVFVSRSLGRSRVSFSCCAKSAIQKRFASTTKIPQPASPRRQASLGLLAVGTLAFGAFGYYWKIRLSSESNSRLSYATFTPLAIRSVEQVTSDSSIITLDLPVDLLPDSSTYPEPPNTPLQAIYIRQPELQIQRAYTPLDAECFSRTDKNEKGPRRIRLLVKRYNDGEVSSYLHRLRTGDQVYVRGPVRTWTVPECDHLIFIAGGTGITPLAQFLAHKASFPSKMTVIYASSTPEQSLIQHAVGTANGLDIHEVKGRITAKQLQSWVGKVQQGERTQIIVCGPEGLITDVAGPRKLNAASDTVAGTLGALGWTSKEVKKL